MTVKKILTATSLQAESHQANTNSTPHGSSRNHTRVPTRMSDPNVKMVPTETKTSGSRATHTVRLADARICMDRVERCGHGKDFGHATRSVGNRELRQPRTRLTGKPVTESNLTRCAPAQIPADLLCWVLARSASGSSTEQVHLLEVD